LSTVCFPSSAFPSPSQASSPMIGSSIWIEWHARGEYMQSSIPTQLLSVQVNPGLPGLLNVQLMSLPSTFGLVDSRTPPFLALQPPQENRLPTLYSPEVTMKGLAPLYESRQV
jgi:hypothetical protein